MPCPYCQQNGVSSLSTTDPLLTPEQKTSNEKLQAKITEFKNNAPSEVVQKIKRAYRKQKNVTNAK